MVPIWLLLFGAGLLVMGALAASRARRARTPRGAPRGGAVPTASQEALERAEGEGMIDRRSA